MKVHIMSPSEDNNIDGALLACSPEEMVSNSSYRKGIVIRKEWMLQIYRMVGPCCKIAYVGDAPEGMIQFNPLHAIPYFVTGRKDALYIHCILVKKVFREKGIGSMLLQSLIDDAMKPNPISEISHVESLLPRHNNVSSFVNLATSVSRAFQRLRETSTLA